LPDVNYGNLPFEEAIDYFAQKGYAFSPASWRDVWQKAHARAFTVARVTAMDVLADIREAVEKGLKDGISLGEFKKGLRKQLERKGWFAPTGEESLVELPDGTVRKRLTAWRLNLIYTQNLQTAYSVGRYKQQQDVKSRRPWWQYMSRLLPTTREEHAAHHGVVRHADHPFWNTWYPPNGFLCKCYVKTLSSRQMEARGLEEQKRGTDQKPDDGWRYNPGKAGLEAWKPDMRGYDPEARKLLQEDVG